MFFYHLTTAEVTSLIVISKYNDNRSKQTFCILLYLEYNAVDNSSGCASCINMLLFVLAWLDF